MENMLVIIGAGGFGREVARLVERINAVSPLWNLRGFLDDDESVQGKHIDGYPVLGNIDWLTEQKEKIHVICAIGTGKTRKKVVERCQKHNIMFATLVDPSASIFLQTTIGEGSIICAGSVLTTDITIGRHVIVNLNCTVGHDASIENYCTIHPGVNISGNVKIGQCTDVGTGTKIIQEIKIGERVTLGAGTVVVNDIPNDCVVVGCPAKPVKHITNGVGRCLKSYSG